MIFTAGVLDGEQAASIGLVNHVVPQNEAGDAAYIKAMEIAQRINPNVSIKQNAGYACSGCTVYWWAPQRVSRKVLTLTVLVATIDAQWEGMGDVGLVRYELALLPPCPTIRVLSYSN